MSQCEICGKPDAQSITRYDMEEQDHVHFAWGCDKWPRCGEPSIPASPEELKIRRQLPKA